MKLTKLVLMLSSSQDGEVVAAARAIEKELVKLGKDWHWLAAKLAGLEPPKVGGYDPVQELRDKMAYVLEHGHNIVRKKDFDFVKDLKRQPYFPTAKQIKYLTNLYDRVRLQRGEK